jgi:hypothetical protein
MSHAGRALTALLLARGLRLCWRWVGTSRDSRIPAAGDRALE